MTYNILAINPGHNGSVALLLDGHLELYIEEERLSRQKYDGNPFRGMIDILESYRIDTLVIGGTSPDHAKLPWTGEDAYTALVRKFNPKVKVMNMGNDHHIGHAAGAFYNSGFDSAVSIVIDGCGSIVQIDEQRQGYETESIYLFKFPNEIKPLFKSFWSPQGVHGGQMHFADDAVTLVKTYEAVSHYLGFGFIEAGKTMGLAPYGSYDENLPNLFIGGRGDKNTFIPQYPAGAVIDVARNPYLQQGAFSKDWHEDESKLTPAARNLAWKIQQETQNMVAGMIRGAVQATGEKNVVISGGYGLNCVANYEYRRQFPDLNIWVDPVSHDGGSAIGLAKLAWFIQDKFNAENVPVKSPLTTLYLGPVHEKVGENKFQEIRNLNPGVKINTVTPEQVAQLIADKNIVALWQGRSEAGPRALGNRSILYDPRDENGKDHVNEVKHREWFRPFAASCLEEKAADWFDLRGMENSPYMMYAVNVQNDKLGQIPAVTHVDGTCRAQTVRFDQNKHYYELIEAFDKITGVPMLFNTSFNLAGEPLVESLDDAIWTLQHSDIQYLYLPEYGKMIVISDKQERCDCPEKSAACACG